MGYRYCSCFLNLLVVGICFVSYLDDKRMSSVLSLSCLILLYGISRMEDILEIEHELILIPVCDIIMNFLEKFAYVARRSEGIWMVSSGKSESSWQKDLLTGSWDIFVFYCVIFGFRTGVWVNNRRVSIMGRFPFLCVLRSRSSRSSTFTIALVQNMFAVKWLGQLNKEVEHYDVMIRRVDKLRYARLD